MSNITANPTPVQNKLVTTTTDMQAEIQRQAEILARKLAAEQVIYEIIAPIHRMAEREEISWEDATKDGTFTLQIPAYLVPHPHGKTDEKGNPLPYRLPAQPILMVAGKGQTRDKAVAQWVERHFGYEAVEVHPNAHLAEDE